MLTGQHECKIDAKGRVRFPQAYTKQLPEDNNGRFMLKMGWKKCLALMPWDAWMAKAKEVADLSEFDPESRSFQRAWLSGAVEVKFDSMNRLNLPKNLMEYAEIEDGKCLMDARFHVIEIWKKENYMEELESARKTLVKLGDSLLGGMKDPLASQATDE